MTNIEKALHACIDLDAIMDAQFTLDALDDDQKYQLIAKFPESYQLCKYADLLADLMEDLEAYAYEAGFLPCSDKEMPD